MSGYSKQKRKSMIWNELKLIPKHCEKCWEVAAQPAAWNHGPVWQLTPGFRVLVFPPNARRTMWTYSTCGMSQQNDAPALEVHLFSPMQTDSHLELLSVVAHYHLTGAYLDLGHTVNFGRSWLPHSESEYGLISLPYLDGPKLEWLETTKRRIRFLWLIPVTQKEVEYKKKNGLEALEKRFDETSLDYINPRRISTVS